MALGDVRDQRAAKQVHVQPRPRPLGWGAPMLCRLRPCYATCGETMQNKAAPQPA